MGKNPCGVKCGPNIHLTPQKKFFWLKSKLKDLELKPHCFDGKSRVLRGGGGGNFLGGGNESRFLFGYIYGGGERGRENS